MASDWQPVSAIVHQPDVSNFGGGLDSGANISGFDRLALAPVTV